MNAPKLSSSLMSRAAALAATLALGATLLPTPSLAAPPKAPPAPTARPATGVVNLNTATPKQLAWLPGIGPSRAQRIVAYRAKHPFKKVLHLARVKGIGLKTVRRLRPYLAVRGATTLTGPIPGKRPAVRKRAAARRGASKARARAVASER